MAWKTGAIARMWMLLLLSAVSSAATAQSLPAPAEFYFDEDSVVARPIPAIDSADDAAINQAVRLMDREGRNAEQAAVQLARLAIATGRADTGQTLYARANALTGEGSVRRRAVQWNQAWDLYRAGDVGAALGLWTQAFSGRVVYPEWVPPTLALALWKLDRRDEAVAWYAAAVRTWPDRWSNPAALPGLLPDWTAADRATLGEVFAAWRENPPGWP